MNKYINSFLLWWFLLPSGIYRRFGADMAHLRAILANKLTIDDRSATGLQKMRNQKDGKETNTATIITMVISLGMGLLFLFVFAMDDDLTRLTFYLTIFGFMLAMFLITDFSHILIDVKDNFIILPKPVTPQTFLLARLLHILVHVSRIIIPMALPGWIGLWISRGLWGAIVFIPILILLTILTFALVNAAYLMIMRLFSPSKINSIITSVQIAFSIILYGGFQLISRILGESFLEQIDLNQYGWIWIFPSYWMAACWSYLYSFTPDPDFILGTVLSIVVPLFSLWLMIRFLAPAFFRKLSMISAGTVDESKKHSTGASSGASSKLSVRIAGIFTQKGIEREAFLFTWRLTGRSRDFKLKVYPQIGYLIILLVLFFLRGDNSSMFEIVAMESPRMRSLIITMIYFSSILYMSAIAQVHYHEQFKAAWVYYSTPLHRPGFIIRGAFKAMMAKFFWTTMMILLIAGLLIFGPGVLPNLVCGFGNVFLLSAMFSWLWVNKLPFSISPKKAGENQSTFRNIAMLIGLPLFGVPHYFLFDFPIVLCIIGVITFSAGWLVLRYTWGIGWDQLK